LATFLAKNINFGKALDYFVVFSYIIHFAQKEAKDFSFASFSNHIPL